jgi:hypothetical protein
MPWQLTFSSVMRFYIAQGPSIAFSARNDPHMAIYWKAELRTCGEIAVMLLVGFAALAGLEKVFGKLSLVPMVVVLFAPLALFYAITGWWARRKALLDPSEQIIGIDQFLTDADATIVPNNPELALAIIAWLRKYAARNRDNTVLVGTSREEPHIADAIYCVGQKLTATDRLALTKLKAAGFTELPALAVKRFASAASPATKMTQIIWD